MNKSSKTITERQGTPFERLFPRTAALVEFTITVVRLLIAVTRAGYLYRVELALTAAAALLWVRLSLWTGSALTGAEILVGVAVAGIVARLLILAVDRLTPRVMSDRARLAELRWGRAALNVVKARGWLHTARAGLRQRWWGRLLLWAVGMRGRGRVVRLVAAGLRELRFANTSGKLPKIRRVRTTAIGERMTLVCRPGQSAELLDVRAEELRAAAHSRDVRINRDPNRSHLVVMDVVRRDPLAATADVPWEGLTTDSLSMWDPVHLGTDENAEPVWLSFVERQLFLGGEPGSGKSAGEQVVTCHAAKSPDAEFVFIDPNRVQFAPWRDRALAGAYDDPDEALEVLQMVRAEGDRRLALLEKLPGVNRKLTREIAEGEGIPLWLLFIDELAYHTSVMGTVNGPFAKASRDIVSRFRAAGIIPIFATQRPTSDVVPTSLRDLFGMRAAFRTTTMASSDVILGENWARRGYSATDIDLTNRGVSWLLAEGAAPRRVKWAWIPDETIAELSMTTIRFKPTPATVGAPSTEDIIVDSEEN